MINQDHLFMQRCFSLALLGEGSVSPNPMVGAVLVHDGRVIGEGWHRKYGEAHAEVRCLESVSAENQHLIPHSTLYCSLEPCFHFGKTPPCVDLVLKHRIPRVVVSNTDPNPLVAGQSLEKLRSAGVEVVEGILEAEGRRLNRAFFTWIVEKRPFIVLKWAQSVDGFIGKEGERTAISGPAALRLVHKWRSEADAILVGTKTAVTDNPRLDARFYTGKNPLRIALDRQGKIPATHHLLDDSIDTWVFGAARQGSFERTVFIPTDGLVDIQDILNTLKTAKRAILLVEGGARVLQQFLDGGWWDEIRVLESSGRLKDGIAAPRLPVVAEMTESFQLAGDTVRIFERVRSF